MIKQILLSLLFWATAAGAQDAITIYTPYSASHGGNSAFQRVLERANQMQNEFKFHFELKPGAGGLISLRTAQENTQNSLSIINAAFLDLVDKKQIQESDWTPVHAIGEACWAVLTLGGNEAQGISSLKGIKELTVGTVGIGNVTHLTGLAIGEKIGVPVRLVLFKSNYDALINLVGDHGVNFAIERYAVVDQFRERNPNIRVIGMSCPTRYAAMNIATLKEQGLSVPGVINIVMASRDMLPARQQKIGQILDRATLDVGLIEIQHLSDMRSPVFDGVSAQQFYRTRTDALKSLRKRYSQQIQQESR